MKQILIFILQLLKSKFSRLYNFLFAEDHIGNSRDHTFADLVLHVTKGKGCDIAFSCVRGELKNVNNTFLMSHEFGPIFQCDIRIKAFFRIVSKVLLIMVIFWIRNKYITRKNFIMGCLI